MNIWLINHYAVPTKFFPLARPASFAKHLNKAGHKVTIFAASAVHNSDINLISDRSKYKEEIVDGIHYVYVRTSQYKGNGKKRIVNMLQYPLRLGSVCRHFEKPDVIIATSVTPMACYAGLKLAKKFKCRGIAEIADLWPESFVAYGLIKANNPILKPMYLFERHLYKIADKIIFTMEGGKDYIIEKGWDKEHGGPVDIDKVKHINNGVDLEAFYYNRENYQIADKDLENGQVFKVVYAGSIRQANNVKSIIDAAMVIDKLDSANIRFLIYGDGNERENLEKYCAENKINNVVFKGFVDKKYIPYILSKSNLNIIHYERNDLKRYGASLNKLFEYFASGKPAISDCEFGYDLIKRYNCGLVVDNADDRQLAEAIIKISSISQEQYNEYCRNSIKAAQDYDFKALTRRLVSIIN